MKITKRRIVIVPPRVAPPKHNASRRAAQRVLAAEPGQLTRPILTARALAKLVLRLVTELEHISTLYRKQRLRARKDDSRARSLARRRRLKRERMAAYRLALSSMHEE